MPEKTQKKMTEEVHQAVLGIEGTEDKGLVGDFKEMVGHIKRQNGRIRKLEITVACLVVPAGGGAYSIFQIFGG